jgi:spore maturation protein CgeB
MTRLRVALFYHSLVSDWNHGNAHFLRGVVAELQARGARVVVYEPEDGWSRHNLLADHGQAPLSAFARAYPGLVSVTYDPSRLAVALDRMLDGVDLVLVHEWNEPEVVAAIGRRRRAGGGFRLLFHDTHHRAVTDPGSMAAYDLADYDGVLAFGEVLRAIYLRKGWAERAWTWHEAADTRVFRPPSDARTRERDGGTESGAAERDDGADRARGTWDGSDDGAWDEVASGDLVWIGNWGDDERSEELHTYLLEPSRALGLAARVYGVRYPAHALAALAEAGVDYGGWLPNHRVPAVFARHRVTVHVPRRPYVQALPGIPTIRPFEALACGIPLVCSPWDDVEGLFTAGRDYLVAPDGDAMRRHLRDVLHDPALARELAEHGRRTVLARHTCAHRVDELLKIAAELGVGAARAPSAPEGSVSAR